MTYGPANTQSPLLNTAEVYPQDPSQLLIKLTDLHSSVANAVNIREISVYENGTEILTGQQFSTPNDPTTKKYSFRKVFYIGAVAAGATLTTAHGITGLVQFTHMYGTWVGPGPIYAPMCTTNTTNVTTQILLYADNTNFYVVVGATSSAITSGIVVLEYLLN